MSNSHMPPNDIATVSKPIRAGLAAGMVLLVLAMLPFTPEPAGDIKGLVIHGMAFLGVFALLLVVRRSGSTMIRPRIFGGLFALYILVNILAVPFSDHPGQGLVVLGYFISLFALYAVAAQVYGSPEHVRSLWFWACVAVGLNSIYAFFQGAGLDPFPWDPSLFEQYQYDNLPGTFGNPNIAGHALVLALVMGGYLVVKQRQRVLTILIALIGVHLLITGHRSALAALVGGIALWAVFAQLRTRFSTGRRGAAAVMAIVLGAGVVAAGAGATYSAFSDDGPDVLDRSLLLRANSFVSTADMVQDRPLTGVGPGAYSLHNPAYWTGYEQREFAERNLVNEHVHNEILHAGVEAGVLAAALLGCLVLFPVYGALWLAFSEQNAEMQRFALFAAVFFFVFFLDGLFGFNFRSPVSGALFALTLGALEGVWARRRDAGKRRAIGSIPNFVGWTGAAIVTAAFLAGVLSFTSSVFLQRGKAALAYGALNPAHESLRVAETLTPWEWRAPLHRAAAAMNQRDFSAAVEHASRSLEHNPNSLAAMTTVSKAHLARALTAEDESRHERLRMARDYAGEAVALCPPYADGNEVLGRVTYHLALAEEEGSDTRAKLLREAAGYLEDAIAYGVDARGETYLLLAEVSQKRGEIEDVREYFEKIARDFPKTENFWPQYFEFALAYEGLDAFVETLQTYAGSLRDEETRRRAEAVHWIARVAAKRGAAPASVADQFEEAIRLLPEQVTFWRAYESFARAWGLSPRFRGFLFETYADAIQDEHDLPAEIHAVAGAAVGREADFANAAGLLANRADVVGSLPESHPFRQDMQWALDYVLRALEKADDRSFESAAMFRNLGKAAASVGARYDADAMYAEAAVRSTGAERASALVNRARALLPLERTAEAEPVLREAVELDPQNVAGQILFARVLARNGKRAEARIQYRKLLAQFELDPATRQSLEAELAAVTDAEAE